MPKRIPHGVPPLLRTARHPSRRPAPLVALHLGDVAPVPGRGLRLLVRRSKTDQHGQGQHVAIWANPAEPLFCPAAALDAWLAHRANNRDLDGLTSDGARQERPLFCAVTKAGRPTGAALSDKAVARLVKAAAGRAGLDEARYSGHSLRAGLATAAGDAGASLPGWKELAERPVRLAKYLPHVIAVQEIRKVERRTLQRDQGIWGRVQGPACRTPAAGARRAEGAAGLGQETGAHPEVREEFTQAAELQTAPQSEIEIAASDTVTAFPSAIKRCDALLRQWAEMGHDQKIER